MTPRKANQTIEQIFHPDNLSARFDLYQKDVSQRGRSLYLNQFLLHLKKAFPEFKEPLDKAITQIKSAGNSTPEQKRSLVLKALRAGCAVIDELSEETLIGKDDVRAILKDLKLTGAVRQQRNPVSPNDYRQDQYFLN
jgi:hypothetical protein